MNGSIAAPLLDWFDATKRDMPWRRTRDPYGIWISEVMLQQTQVDTVRSYWERFMRRFPTVTALAEAPVDDLLKAWEGLGYYSRARNLQAAARQIVERHGGSLPSEPGELARLTGIGPYTAGAVASIAFGRPEPAVDGNVVRVFSRLFWLDDDAARPAGRARLEGIARSLLAAPPAADRPGDFNQALMELGATVCTPRAPDCAVCPVRERCLAHATGDPEARPLRRSKPKVPYAEIAVGVCAHQGRVLVARRPTRGLLAGFLAFPSDRLAAGEPVPAGVSRALEASGVRAEILGPWMEFPFVFSSLRTTHKVFRAGYLGGAPVSGARWVDRRELEELALPTAFAPIREALLATPDWASLGPERAHV